MSNSSYDPDFPLPSSEWLNMSESERLQRVTQYHTVNRIKAGSVQAHAAFHVTVENQIAMGQDSTVKAMARLQKDGLPRHEALHAIASVIAKQVYGVLRSPPGADDQSSDLQALLDSAIDALDAQAWLDSHSD